MFVLPSVFISLNLIPENCKSHVPVDRHTEKNHSYTTAYSLLVPIIVRMEICMHMYSDWSVTERLSTFCQKFVSYLEDHD